MSLFSDGSADKESNTLYLQMLKLVRTVEAAAAAQASKVTATEAKAAVCTSTKNKQDTHSKRTSKQAN